VGVEMDVCMGVEIIHVYIYNKMTPQSGG